MINNLSIIADTLTNSSYASSSMASVFGAFSLLYLGFMCLYFVFLAYYSISIVFSVIAVIDIANRSIGELPDKITWILLIYPFGPALLYIPTYIYFFKKKKELDRK